jgi:menaquinone-dependent protoporphyrinogen oxidase
MKTIILYATKYGAAGEVAHRIAKGIKDAAVYDIKQGGIPDLAAFDNIIIGSSIYAGMMRKEAKVFMSQNAGVLREKKLGLFISGLGGSEEEVNFEKIFPNDIFKAAKAVSFLGGIFDPKKANIMERLIIKIVTKQSGYVNNIDDSKIERFIEVMGS